MEISTKSHINSNTIMLQSTLFLLALLPNGMSTDEPAVVSCCSPGNYSNIDNVLKHAQSLNDTITIHIQPGNYTLPSNYQFHSKSKISIQGSGENLTVLNCDKPDNGVAFFNSNEIEVSNLSIVGCGGMYTRTSTNIKICTKFLPFQAALYFEFCKNVTVSSVSILHSNRTGLAFFNTVGSVKIFNSEFSGIRFGDAPEGERLYIEFTSNVPGHKTKELSMLKVTYLLSNCTFLENQEMPGLMIIVHLCDCFPLLMKGSRMTVYFNGNASGNNVSIYGCMFSRMSTKVGGGLFVSFSDNIDNNKVQLASRFQYNNRSLKPSFIRSRLHGNWAAIGNSNFTDSSAHWGRRLSKCSETVPHMERTIAKVTFQGCHFEKNVTRRGAAVDILFFDNITFPECSFVLRIINCTLLNNRTSHSQTAFQKLNSNNKPCPPGYGRKNTSSSCECLPHSFAGYVTCQQETNSSIFIGYCISYSEIEMKGKSSKQVIVAKCPLFSAYNVFGPTIPLPMDVNQLDEAFCTEHWNRTGRLCNKCTNGTGISVFSITYNCIECTESVTNWLIYIAVTILPLTFFFLIVVVFQVGVTYPQANGYIFFSQIITIPLHELIIEVAWALALKDKTNTTTEHVLTNLLLFPYSVWSLDFFRIFFARDICLHKSMRIIHVLALQYIPALYPLCLVIISYILIELHARNCRPVVWLWKPFCFLCVRFRRNWEAKTSIIDAFATFLLLSYTKILLVSFSLLTPTDILITNGTSVGKIMNYDPSVDFFQGDHLPFAILALVILITIGAIPPLLLLLYPSHRFQRLLSFFKLQSHGLQTFVDAFQGCYKNGADGGPERRFFAGIYFLFRIIVFLIFTTATSIQKMFTALQITYTVYILAFVIFRPYKKDRYNILDTVFITILAVTGTTGAYLYTYLLNSTKFLNGLWYFTYALLYIPTLYMAGYIIYWFFNRSRCVQTHCIQKICQQNEIGGILYHYTHLRQAHRPTTFSVSDFPDRVRNPHCYEHSPHLDVEDHENELPNVDEHVSRREGKGDIIYKRQ